MLKATWAICSLLFVATVAVSAQTSSPPPLTSNRPGIGDSEVLVPRRAIQVEAGAQAAESSINDQTHRTLNWGTLTVRAGLTERVEVFAGWDGLSVDRVHAAGESRVQAGGNDLLVGAKIAVFHEETQGLTLTLSPAWSFPVGDPVFSSGSQDGSFRALWARSLPRDWGLSGNVLFVRTSDEAGRYWDNTVTFSASHPLTDALSAYGEAAGILLANGPDAWTIDGGFAWIVGTDVQLDVSAGHTFANRGDHWFVSGGVTIRRLPRSSRLRAPPSSHVACAPQGRNAANRPFNSAPGVARDKP